jgi:hypothetical protein
MPKELTHWILADRAAAGLGSGSRLRELIHEHHDSYLGGAVLPDTLLHPIRGSHAGTARSLADRFHNTAGNSFAPLIHAEQRFPGGLPPAILACLLGVITHIQTDIVFHPFAFALTGSGGMGRHYRIETDIDLHFLRRGTRPAVRHLSDLMSPGTQGTLVAAAGLLFDPGGLLPRQALEQALERHCRFQGMYDRTFWKLAVRAAALLAGDPYREQRNLFYPLAGPGRDIFGHNPVEWRHPVSREARRNSLEQLADEAVQRTVSTFERIETAGSLAAALADRPGENLLTGMQGACLDAMGSRRR